MKPVVCWDFDETLGYFRPLEFKFLGIEPPFAMPPVRLKPGIRELLESLSEFTHVVTTAAMELYAREVLHGQGLLDCFADVIGRESGLFRADGKDYKVVGDRLGIAESELARRLVIVGNDSERDPDLRYRGIVMVFDEALVDHPSEPLGVVLRRLVREGGGEVRAGFDRLLEAARSHSADGVKFELDFWGTFADDRIHPMVVRPRATASKLS